MLNCFFTFPKFLNFKLPQHIYNDSDATSLKRRALYREIQRRERELQKLQHQCTDSWEFFRSRLSYFRYSALTSLLYTHGQRQGDRWRRILDRKLISIWTSQRPAAPCSALRNTSDYKLSRIEEQALRLGLDHCIAPPHCDRIGVQTAFEKFTRFRIPTIPETDRPSFISGMRYLMNSYISSSNNVCNTFSN